MGIGITFLREDMADKDILPGKNEPDIPSLNGGQTFLSGKA
jgi:hypothetical protein